MLISLFKYSGNDYFDTTTTDFIDKIQFTTAFKKSPPEIFEEYVKEDDISQFHCGEMDLCFFLGDSTTSTNGDNIETFLTPDDAVVMLALFEVGGKYRGGIIEQGEINVNKSTNKGEYEVSIKVTGILKHTIEHLKKYNIFEVTGASETFDSHVMTLMAQQNSSWLGFYNQLSLSVKVGQDPKINYVRQQGMWHGGLNQGYSIWSALQSFAMFLGFAIRVDFEVLLNDGKNPRFAMKIFWLSDGVTQRTIKFKDNRYSYSWENANKMFYLRVGVGINDSYALNNYEYGMIVKRDEYYISDNWINIPRYVIGTTPVNPAFYRYSNECLTWRRLKWIGGTWFEENTPPPNWDTNNSSTDIVEIQMPYHSWGQAGIINSYLAYAAILTLGATDNDLDFTGLDTILQKTAMVEYQYMISGIKQKREGDIEFLPTDQIGLHDYFYASKNGESVTFRIDRIETDLLNRTAKIRAIEQ